MVAPISPIGASTGRFGRVRFRRACVAGSAATAFSCRSTKWRRIHNSRAMSTRGEHLVRADRGFATGGGLIARFTAPAFAKVLDEIDRRLARGGIEVTLPDG